MELDRRKRREIERAKAEELAKERDGLWQWQRTVEDAGDESDCEDCEAPLANELPEDTGLQVLHIACAHRGQQQRLADMNAPVPCRGTPAWTRKLLCRPGATALAWLAPTTPTTTAVAFARQQRPEATQPRLYPRPMRLLLQM